MIFQTVPSWRVEAAWPQGLVLASHDLQMFSLISGSKKALQDLVEPRDASAHIPSFLMHLLQRRSVWLKASPMDVCTKSASAVAIFTRHTYVFFAHDIFGWVGFEETNR